MHKNMQSAVMPDQVQGIDLKERHKVSLTFEVFYDNLKKKANKDQHANGNIHIN
jgi:hypothetical protein